MSFLLPRIRAPAVGGWTSLPIHLSSGGAVRRPFIPFLKTVELSAQYIDDQAATESPGEFRILFRREKKQLLNLAFGFLLQGKHFASSVVCAVPPRAV